MRSRRWFASGRRSSRACAPQRSSPTSRLRACSPAGAAFLPLLSVTDSRFRHRRWRLSRNSRIGPPKYDERDLVGSVNEGLRNTQRSNHRALAGDFCCRSPLYRLVRRTRPLRAAPSHRDGGSLGAGLGSSRRNATHRSLRVHRRPTTSHGHARRGVSLCRSRRNSGPVTHSIDGLRHRRCVLRNRRDHREGTSSLRGDPPPNDVSPFRLAVSDLSPAASRPEFRRSYCRSEWPWGARRRQCRGSARVAR